MSDGSSDLEVSLFYNWTARKFSLVLPPFELRPGVITWNFGCVLPSHGNSQELARLVPFCHEAQDKPCVVFFPPSVRDGSLPIETPFSPCVEATCIYNASHVYNMSGPGGDFLARAVATQDDTGEIRANVTTTIHIDGMRGVVR